MLTIKQVDQKCFAVLLDSVVISRHGDMEAAYQWLKAFIGF